MEMNGQLHVLPALTLLEQSLVLIGYEAWEGGGQSRYGLCGKKKRKMKISALPESNPFSYCLGHQPCHNNN